MLIDVAYLPIAPPRLESTRRYLKTRHEGGCLPYGRERWTGELFSPFLVECGPWGNCTDANCMQRVVGTGVRSAAHVANVCTIMDWIGSFGVADIARCVRKRLLMAFHCDHTCPAQLHNCSALLQATRQLPQPTTFMLPHAP